MQRGQVFDLIGEFGHIGGAAFLTAVQFADLLFERLERVFLCLQCLCQVIQGLMELSAFLFAALALDVDGCLLGVKFLLQRGDGVLLFVVLDFQRCQPFLQACQLFLEGLDRLRLLGFQRAQALGVFFHRLHILLVDGRDGDRGEIIDAQSQPGGQNEHEQQSKQEADQIEQPLAKRQLWCFGHSNLLEKGGRIQRLYYTATDCSL
ncbi:MAG: hypothetical protein D6803_01005 [Anaerolineae bacterium]|nr:MAG: hypothetical protein D6803_01005 [Anaerolineae bacterium]